MFRKRLKLCRTSAGLTQIELAKKLLIGNKTISDYERGISNPDFDTIKRIASFFNVSVDYLLGETDNPSPTLSTSTQPPVHESNEVLVALYDQTEGLSEEQLQQVIDYVQFLKSKNH